MKKTAMISAILVMALCWALGAGSDDCGEHKKAGVSCRIVEYRDLPGDIKKLMGEKHCAVAGGEGMEYSYGAAVFDLNGDGSLEYLVCCPQPMHGPCNTAIFGKHNGKWADIGNGELISMPDCETAIVLDAKDEGYHRICSYGDVFKFSGSAYAKVKSPYSPDPGEGGYYEVTGVAADDALNVREEPNPGAPIITALPPGTACVRWAGESRQHKGRAWWKISIFDGMNNRWVSGWASSKFLQPQKDTDACDG